jgi:hypothetical protein
MRVMSVVVMILALVMIGGTAAAAEGERPVAQPYGSPAPGDGSYSVDREAVRIPIGHLDLGAEHILDQQCHNGGFGWPHDDCSATYHNITGPILLGVMGAYAHTQDPLQLVGALNGGAFDLSSQYDNGEFRFSTYTPVFLHELALRSGNTTFSTHVETNLFGELAAGTYSPDDYDTAGWITAIEDNRTGSWVNLRPWEFSTLVDAAAKLGQPGQADLFEQAVLDGLSTLDNSDAMSVFSDIIGIAGAVRGLAAASRLGFPAISAPLHAGVDGITTLEDLVAYLTSLQNPDGSWYWHSNLPAPIESDKDVQTTAFALLALLEADLVTAVSSVPAAEAARNWMVSLQTPDGGFPMGPGLDENTEVEGEALLAIADFDATIFVDGFEAGTTVLWDRIVP